MSNNCKTCEYKHSGDGHCYMFKEKPADTCLQHKLTKPVVVLTPRRYLKGKNG